MKHISILLLIILFNPIFRSSDISDECEVKEFYRAVDADDDVMVLTSSGDLEEAEVILVPTRMEEGTFKIDITRKGSNLYKIDGTDYYLETRYCYEYATRDEAILKVESNYGYNKGVIIFNP
jgi:hypothetical protein